MRHETFSGTAVEIEASHDCTCAACQPHGRLMALSAKGGLSIERPVSHGDGFTRQSINHTFSHVENIPARVVHPFATIPQDRFLRRAG